MDRVRLGRVLGIGVRQAAKTLVNAAEAVAAPDPSPHAPEAPGGVAEPAVRPTRAAIDPAAVRAQTRHLRNSVWSSFARFSSVLWLEVTGTFFAIFAVFLGSTAWRLRGVIHTVGSVERSHFFMDVALGALFAYFAVSSFVRARRRERR